VAVFGVAPVPATSSDAASAQAASPSVVISQVYGGGGNSGATLTHDFIELFNRGAARVDLDGWSVQYASSGGSSWQQTNLSGTLDPGQYYLVQQAAGAGGTTPLPTPDATGSIAMAAGSAKVALLQGTTALSGTCPSDPSIIDLVGYGASASCFEGSGPTPTLNNTTAALRAEAGCRDTDDNADDFATGAPDPRNTAAPANPCDVEPPDDAPVVVQCGTPPVVIEGFEASTTVAASDADGVVADIAVSGVDPDPAPGSIAVSDLTPATEVGGTASAEITIDDAVPPGSYALTVTATNDDDPAQTGQCTLTVTVEPVRSIGEVQGAVGDADDGPTHRSPFAPPSGNGNGQTVVVRGVIAQRTLARSSSGANQNGFFLQSTADTADGDPTSSDGIFVFHGVFNTLLRLEGGSYVPQVGDEVILRGPVVEFFSLTELSNPRLVQVVRQGVDLDVEAPAFELDPPDDLDDAGRYWERREGMQGRLAAGSVVIGGRDVFASTLDAEVWAIHPDHPVAQRDDPFARRVFRDAHPLDNNPDQNFDDGNGYRIVLGSFGVKAAAGDNTELIAPARTFDTVTNSPVGGVYFSFSKYQVMVGENLALEHGPDPSTNAPPQPADRQTEYSVASFNVENLYDFRDDPFDGCDFAGNRGCEDFFGNLSVTPPFDFVPGSDAEYQARLDRLAEQIVTDLHAPDVVQVQEAEDQDVCTVTGGELGCQPDAGEVVDDRDGKPDTVQELALAIADAGGPTYDAVYDRDGADTRGIVNAFLYRTDRVELLPAEADDPIFGSDPSVDYRGEPAPFTADVQNPKALDAELPDDVDCSTGCLDDTPFVHSRAPQVGLFRIWRDGIGASVFTDVYLVNNHFSSGPDGRVGQRTEQATYNAAIVEAIRNVDDDARLTVGGDLNVFPRPDDPFRPGDPLFPSDQLAPLYDAGLNNLHDVLVDEEPASAYSFVFQGQAQTLDQVFVADSLLDELVEFRSAKINADWPAEFDGFGRFGASDHDPEAGRFTAIDIDRLRDLVDHFEDSGDISNSTVARALRQQLDRAERSLERGNLVAYRTELTVFAALARAFSPTFVTPQAADALATDVTVLRDAS
jgi:predicted extracellular nuclease